MNVHHLHLIQKNIILANIMDAKQRTPSGMRSYESFEPKHQWIEESNTSNLIVHLPGFKKEQIKVQVDTFGTLRVSAERPVEGTRWRRYRKDFRIPETTNVHEIKAKFENEALYVSVPKPITQTEVTEQHEQPKPTPEPPAIQKEMQADDKGEEEKTVPKKEDDKEKKVEESSGAKESPTGYRQSKKEKLKCGIGRLTMKAKEPRTLMMNVVATVILLVIGAAIYMRHKMRESGQADNYEVL
ncbi:Small heat shock protein HSP20 protein [Dioscorea alata]|uniref:Small heat shock protein HSP20 protein n=1 Tax=Dioscorea alata TaxID=55571 RepID=A0ACB7WVW8_DIOAL|nr:Small heat shock protein HSP20 protein [Dioscorea alata]